MHASGKEIVFGGGMAKKFLATKCSEVEKAAFQKVWGTCPRYLWHWKEVGGEYDGGILQLNWVKLLTFAFSGVPFFFGIHIVRLTVGTKLSTLLSILSDGPTD